jgi:hypothetical protein
MKPISLINRRTRDLLDLLARSEKADEKKDKLVRERRELLGRRDNQILWRDHVRFLARSYAEVNTGSREIYAERMRIVSRFRAAESKLKALYLLLDFNANEIAKIDKLRSALLGAIVHEGKRR